MYDDQENIDLVFVGVFCLDADFGFHGLRIVDPTEEEIARLEGRTGVKVRDRKTHCNFYVLESGETRYYIGASGYTVEENSFDLMETSLGTRYSVAVT